MAHAAGQIDDHVVLQRRALGGVSRQYLGVGHVALQVHLRLRGPQYADERVVGQVLADARRVDQRLDAVLAQVVRRPDAGQHEYLWRTDRARAQDDLLRLHHEALVSGGGLDARGPRTLAGRVEQYPLDRHVAPNR